MRENSANNELLPTILDILQKRDENMQKEVALSLIEPIKLGLFNDKSKILIV